MRKKNHADVVQMYRTHTITQKRLNSRKYIYYTFDFTLFSHESPTASFINISNISPPSKILFTLS